MTSRQWGLELTPDGPLDGSILVVPLALANNSILNVTGPGFSAPLIAGSLVDEAQLADEEQVTAPVWSKIETVARTVLYRAPEWLPSSLSVTLRR